MITTIEDKKRNSVIYKKIIWINYYFSLNNYL